MVDPFDFEPRLAARLASHAGRASRPFDATAIAATAAAPSRGIGARPRAVAWVWHDGRLSTLRVAFVVLLMAVALTAATLLVGALLRQAPLPDRSAVVPPQISPSPTAIHDPDPSPAPSVMRPEPTAAPSGPTGTPPPATPGKGLLTIGGDIFITNGDAGARVKIADGDAWVDGGPNRHSWRGARWSGSGDLIAANLGPDAVVMRHDGSVVRRFTNAEFAWAPSGNRLWVSDDRAGRVIDLATSNEWRLPLPKGAEMTDPPTFSPDGKRLAVQVCSPCNAEHYGPTDLWSFVISTGRHEIITNSPDVREAWPTWSPDGRTIASWWNRCLPAVGLGPCNTTTHIVDANGGSEIPIVAGWSSVWPAWSPDSRHLAIAYAAKPLEDLERAKQGIATVSVDGSSTAIPEPLLLTPLSPTDQDSPAGWSVDGRRIYMTRFHPDPNINVTTSGPAELWWLDALGGGQRQLAIGLGLDWDVRP